MPVREIKDASIAPCWATFLGSMAGAVCAVDRTECSLADLAGRTGFAFRLNIHPELCPSGPTALPAYEFVRRAFDQVAWDFDFFFAASTDNLFSAFQKRAVAAIEDAITRGVPSIVWGAAEPEYGLVTGFDRDARRFRVSTAAAAGEKMDLPYGQLGLGPVAWLHVVVPLEKVEIDRAHVAAEALKFAVLHARGGEARVPGYTNGLAAYALWIEALRGGRAGSFGMAYNTQVYAEARRFAKAYLADLAAADLFGASQGLAAVAESYEHVADNMGNLAEMFPFQPGVPHAQKVPADKASEAAALLERALFWEADGVAKLETVFRNRAG